MLQAMRENTKIILWVTVIFFVLLIFLVWGADLQLGGKAQPNTMGIVDGVTISYTDFQRVYQQNRQAATSQGADLQPSQLIAIEERTWNDLVENILLQNEADRLDLGAKDVEVRNTMLNRPPAVFQRAFVDSTGRFDYQSYRRYILNPATPERELVAMESYIRGNLPVQKLQQIIISGAIVTDAEVRQAFLDQNEQVEVSYVLVPSPAVNNPPSDEEVAAHFEETKEEYILPRRADLLYVTIPRTATARDSSDIVTEMKEFASEARRAVTETDESTALQYSDFETLAMTFSDGPNADAGGLSAGYLTPEEMSPSMAAAVDGLAPGDISTPYLDGGMYHIVQVVDEKIENGQRQVQIRDLARRVAPSDSTLEANREQLETLRTEAQSKGLEAAAQAGGYSVQRVNDVTASGFAPGLSLVPGIGHWALLQKPGALSRVYTSNDGWHLVEVVEIKDSGYPTLETVKGRVRADLLSERRLAAAEPRAHQLVGQVKLGKTLEAAASGEGLEVQKAPAFTRAGGMPDFSQSPKVVAAAFAGSVGQVMDPVDTDRGWVILRVDAKPEIDESLYQTQAPSIRNSLLGTKRVNLYNAYLDDLRERADIQDFRS